MSMLAYHTLDNQQNAYKHSKQCDTQQQMTLTGEEMRRWYDEVGELASSLKIDMANGRESSPGFFEELEKVVHLVNVDLK